MIDRKRLLRMSVLGAWSLFLFWLWLSGEMTRYLGPRTLWVIVFGAIALGLAAVAHLPALRTGHATRPARGDVAGALILVLPILAVVLLPDAQLGAQAASRKASAGGFAAASLLPVPDPSGEISFAEIHYASQSEEYAAEAGIVEGIEVELVGFVTQPKSSGDFSLTRFYVSCCAADAIPYSVPVQALSAAGAPAEDTWLRIEGSLVTGDASGFVLRADRMTPVSPPDEPYLY
jgi:putative membrane protein